MAATMPGSNDISARSVRTLSFDAACGGHVAGGTALVGAPSIPGVPAVPTLPTLLQIPGGNVYPVSPSSWSPHDAHSRAGAEPAFAPSIRDLPGPAARRVHLRRCRSHQRLPGRARRQPPLLLA